MADQVDDAQAINDLHLDAALRHHLQREATLGRSTCANLDCCEPISDYRRLGGAQLCLTCQEGEERRGKHFATWARR